MRGPFKLAAKNGYKVMRTLTLAQIAHLLNCSAVLPPHAIQGYSIDSRLVKPGELFFALKGERVDGHDFLLEVQQRGAIAAVVSKNYQGSIPGLHLLPVEDPLQALQELAQTLLARCSSRVVAITGSIGKTSTKEFIKTLLATRYHVAASPGNSNSQVGIPLTILNHTTGEEDILVLEMGMTTSGHLARLVQIAPPEVAVLTTIALVHACNFESIEEIARAKAEIFSHPHTRLGILHRDIPIFSEICQTGNCPKLSFSTQNMQADYVLDMKTYELKTPLEDERRSLSPLPIPGKHNLHNFLVALAVARYFDVSWEAIQQAIPTLSLPDRRLQFVQHKQALFLNDSYNASEFSVKAALEILPPPAAGGKKIAVLGSMLELGKFSDDCHARVGEFALQHVEELYCLGEECRPIYDIWSQAGRAVRLFNQRQELVHYLRQILQPVDVVLLKGSRSKELWKVLEEL